MAVVSIPLAQALVDLEVRGATGRMVVSSAAGEHAVEVVHGRLGVPTTDTGDVCYVHGLDGDPVAAEVAAVDALADRLATAMADAGASWDFHELDVEPRVSSPTSVVVRDARRRLAESERLAIQLPGDDLAPDRVPEARTRGIHLSRLLGNVYAAVDGERSVRKLATELGIPVEASRRAVFRLATLGLVQFDARDTPMAAPFTPTADWAADSLADAVEEPEPWVGYANGGSSPETSTSRRPRRTSTKPRLAPPHGPNAGREDAAEAPAAEERPRVPRTVPPDRRRPVDPEEQRESLREAAAWLAEIDHQETSSTDAAPATDEPASAEPPPPPVAEQALPDRSPPAAAEDVSDFLRELSQLSRDDD